MVIDTNDKASQNGFGALVGISQQTVSNLVAEGTLSRNGTFGQWLIEYAARLREVAAGRASSGDLDLVQERAGLARAQREGQEIKNAVARGEYAPIEALTDVLSTASQAVVDRLDQIPAALKRVAPDLPQAARDVVMSEIASARNEMVRRASSLVDSMDASEKPVEDEGL